MDAGRVLAEGPLNEVQSDPRLPLAGSRDAAVSLNALVLRYDSKYGLATLAVEGTSFTVPMSECKPGDARRMRIGAGDVSLARERPSVSTILNVVPAFILARRSAGEHEIIAVLGFKADGTGVHLLSRLTRRSWDELGLAEGMAVYAQVKGVALAPVRRAR